MNTRTYPLQKLLVLTTIFTLLFTISFGQIFTPVKWSFETKKTGDKEYELIFIATIDEGWHVYSTDVPPGGPVATSFIFEDSENWEKVGEMIVPEAVEKYDNAFEMDLAYFEGEAVFIQKVKVLGTELSTIKGELEFMACDDTQCLPPDYVEFDFPVGQGAGDTYSNADEAYSMIDETYTTIAIESALGGGEDDDDESLLMFFLIALGLGFIGCLTPCVYPMIPMTVSFFMNASSSKVKAKSQALFFGASIIFIYTVLGVLVTVLFGGDAIKNVSNHWLSNLIFFLLFATFAASFFGMFEIVLPSWVTSKSDKQADKGGFIGAFFMALTLVLVSVSCTAPFIGGILVEAASGELIKPVVGMFGFSLAFGIVFSLLALFPALLSKMPSSGGWLNSVKVVLAFLILAIGMKYLLVANAVLHWNIMREMFIAIWIVLFILLGFYLLGKIKFAHDSPVNHISVPRLLLVIIAFTCAVYLVPGMFGAPLKAVSGFLPTESAWDLDEIIIENTRNIQVVSQGKTKQIPSICEEPKYTDLFHLPHGLEGYYDLEQGIACAKKLNKPIFLDIKGHACTNCKVMEKNVWSDPEVLKRLRDEFIIIALYVDERSELPESEWVTSSFDGKVKKTIGRKNADYQITVIIIIAPTHR